MLGKKPREHNEKKQAVLIRTRAQTRQLQKPLESCPMLPQEDSQTDPWLPSELVLLKSYERIYIECRTVFGN